MVEIMIISREKAFELLETGFPDNSAVISFYDPGSDKKPPVDYSGAECSVFRVGVRDIDIEVLPQYNLTYDTYLPEAPALAEYIVKAVKDGKRIICQCEYGQSRSAACAAAILQYYEHRGIDFFADYRYYPNQLVYHKIYDALVQTGENDGFIMDNDRKNS